MEDQYWPAKCRACGWRGSSKDTNGGLSIADTGDYSELRCPACDSTLIDEADMETDLPSNAALCGPREADSQSNGD